MNGKELHLPELELQTGQVRDALQCLLHTILFIRSPGPVTPQDVECEDFGLRYARIESYHPPTSSQSPRMLQHQQYRNATATNKNNNSALSNQVDTKVDDAIEAFLQNLSQIGPELLSGCLTLSFFERRATRQLFGLVSHEERIVFEQWILRVVVNNTPRPLGNDSAAVIERQRLQDTAECMLRTAMSKIFELASGSLDHIPPVMYEFEISCSRKPDDRENMYSRVTNMPPILNLSI